MASSFAEKYGRYALITGASKGLGVDFANTCARNGLNLILVARSEDLLRKEAARLRGEFGVDVKTIALDLSGDNILEAITPVTDPLEVGLLINNAGISRVRPFLEHTLDQLLTQLHLNTRAGLVLSYHFGKKMAERRRGGIMFLSSASAMNGTAYVANYAGTKAYNLILGESLWQELGKYGIDVLGFMPGSTKTPGWDKNQPKKSFIVRVMDSDKAVAEAFNALGKKPSHVAGWHNRLAYFIMEKFMTRPQKIRTVSRSMVDIFGPFGL